MGNERRGSVSLLRLVARRIGLVGPTEEEIRARVEASIQLEREEERKARKEKIERIRKQVSWDFWTAGVIRGHIPRPKASQKEFSEETATEQTQ